MAARVHDEVILAHCCEVFELLNFVGTMMEIANYCV